MQHFEAAKGRSQEGLLPYMPRDLSVIYLKCTPSFPFILEFWAFISFHFGLLNFPEKPSGQDLA